MTFDQALEAWPQLLNDTLSKRSSQKVLLQNIATLAKGFTFARDERVKGYLGRASLLEAYLWWYLPWNLLKMREVICRISVAPPTQITDMGAGPAAFSIALFLLKPEWRTLPLGWTLVEPEGLALDAGLNLLRLFFENSPPPWKFTRVKQRLGVRIQRRADWVVASHVWNESPIPPANFLKLLQRDATPDALFWVLEPGDRQGARRVVALRSKVLDAGITLRIPCTHRRACPAPGDRNGNHFCHFPSHAVVPSWLRDLAEALGFTKVRNPVSYLVFGGKEGAEDNTCARVISDPIPMDGKVPVRYACGPDGLLVAESGGRLTWGETFHYQIQGLRDSKTQGWRVKVLGEEII